MRSFTFRSLAALTLAIAASLAANVPAAAQAPATDTPSTDAPATAKPAPVEAFTIGEIRNLHRCGSLFIAGQPTPADIALLTKHGVKCVINYRTDGEVTWDEKGAVESQGIQYISLPYGTIDSLTDEVFAQTRKLFLQFQGQPILAHCGAAPRVAAVWLAFRVLDEKVALETALAEAEKLGLKSKGLRERALEYIKAQQAK